METLKPLEERPYRIRRREWIRRHRALGGPWKLFERVAVAVLTLVSLAAQSLLAHKTHSMQEWLYLVWTLLGIYLAAWMGEYILKWGWIAPVALDSKHLETIEGLTAVKDKEQVISGISELIDMGQAILPWLAIYNMESEVNEWLTESERFLQTKLGRDALVVFKRTSGLSSTPPDSIPQREHFHRAQWMKVDMALSQLHVLLEETRNLPVKP